MHSSFENFTVFETFIRHDRKQQVLSYSTLKCLSLRLVATVLPFVGLITQAIKRQHDTNKVIFNL